VINFFNTPKGKGMPVIEQHRIEIEDSLQEETEELPRLQSLSDVLSEIEDTEYESLYESFDAPELYSITPEEICWLIGDTRLEIWLRTKIEKSRS
jgi:hypothetical protein